MPTATKLAAPTRHTLVVALAATLAGTADAAFVLDTVPGTRDQTVILSSDQNGIAPANVVAQSFTLPTAAGSDTLLDTFEVVADGFTQSSSQTFGAELRGYFGVFDAVGNGLTILAEDVVERSAPTVPTNNDIAVYESFLFTPRDASSGRVQLMPGSRYAVIVTADDNVGEVSSSKEYAVTFEAGSDPVVGGFDDGTVFTFEVPSADLAINDSIAATTVGTGNPIEDLGVVITLVPEPATAALALSGGLLLLRRRA